ncbi:unnamed protein product [Ectocarpus sp. CCAP 1310/34]|nr:unnamed protein product [Ectocarpus sp. CCAP 1310/34]
MRGKRFNPCGRMTTTIKLLLGAAAAAGLLGSNNNENVVLAQTTTSGSSPLSSNPDGCVADYDAAAGVDYFPDKAVIEYAETFTVDYLPTYKVLTVSDGFSDTVYVLYQCGTPVPDLDDTTVVQQYISIPVSNVSTGTTDHVPRIELLGHRDSIVAYTGNVGLIGSPCVDELVDNGTVVQALTFDTVCGQDIIDNEALVNASVEVAFGDSLTTSLCENATMVHNGVAVVAYQESGEAVGLGRAEAIKLFSLFYNEEARANELFDEIETVWFCTKTNAQGCSLELDESPTVAWFPFLPTDQDSLYYEAGSGWGEPTLDSYYGQAVNDTGGTMLDCGVVEGLMTDEEMLACFADADICVFAADYGEVELFFDADVLSQLRCIQNQTAYDVTLSGINAWFEAIWVEPHVLMQDMVAVLHGDDDNVGIGEYERLLLRNVFTEQNDVGSYYSDVGTCDDPDAILELQGGDCELLIDFGDCGTSVTADAESPGSRVLPTGFALAVVAGAAAFLW